MCPTMVLSFSTTPAESSNISPPQQLYNAALCLPTQFHTQPLSEAPASPPPSGLPLPQPIHHNIPLSTSPPSTFPPKLLHASHILVHRDAAAPVLLSLRFTLIPSSHFSLSSFLHTPDQLQYRYCFCALPQGRCHGPLHSLRLSSSLRSPSFCSLILLLLFVSLLLLLSLPAMSIL